MITVQELKSIWKKIGIKGQVKNFSSKPLWVLETDKGKPIAHILLPMTKSPIETDIDAFKRKDGKAIENHTSWWKFYDFSIAEIIDSGEGLKISIISKTAVSDKEFSPDNPNGITYDETLIWGVPIQLITDIKRDKNKNILSYFVTGAGWVEKVQVLEMTCYGKIDNARPVFPKSGEPYVRTGRDQELLNNISILG